MIYCQDYFLVFCNVVEPMLSFNTLPLVSVKLQMIPFFLLYCICLLWHLVSILFYHLNDFSYSCNKFKIFTFDILSSPSKSYILKAKWSFSILEFSLFLIGFFLIGRKWETTRTKSCKISINIWNTTIECLLCSWSWSKHDLH